MSEKELRIYLGQTHWVKLVSGGTFNFHVGNGVLSLMLDDEGNLITNITEVLTVEKSIKEIKKTRKKR